MGIEPDKHNPSDKYCVCPGDKVNGARKCKVCAKYNNGVWLTQYEKFNE